MIQLQVLNYIIKQKDSEFLTTFSEEFFPSYESEYKFIKDHYLKYKNIPDVETVLEKFNKFNVLDVRESKKFLQDKLVEEYSYSKSVEIINKGGEMFTVDSRKAVDYIVRNLADIKAPTRKFGTNIIKSASNRYDKFLHKLNSVDDNEYSFASGLPELDLLLDGIRRGEELIVLYARTNNGKSWIAEKIATSIWADGFNVGFFSPEMSDDEVGYRFDTLFKNFSNHSFNGRDREFNADSYSSYIKKLTKHDNEFNVTSPLDFDKEVTVSKIKRWIEELSLDFIVIDGLSYLYNERGQSKKETDRLTDIAEDLMSLSMEMKIPIVAVMQANRTAARDSNGEVNDDAPELDTIRNSDGISHNASRAISVRQKDGILTLKITKNRYGVVGNKLTYNWDINTGRFTYLPNPKAKLPEGENEKIAEENRNQFEDDSEQLF